MKQKLAVIGLAAMLTGCAVEDGRSGALSGLEDGEELPLSVDGTMHLMPGEPDPRVPANASNQALVAQNPCEEPVGVLVFGDDVLGRNALAPVLESMGHIVTNTFNLPEDLGGYSAIFHVGLRAQLVAAERERLALFLEFGGAVHLTGERPCCDTMNDSLTLFVRDVVEGGESITVGRQGDVPSLSNDPFFPFLINPDAKGGIAGVPNAAAALRLASPGGIAGIADPENVLVVGLDNVPVGAIWDKDDLVGRGGRLSIIMDTNWFTGLALGDNLALLENMVGFMCEATPADEDGDGVIARLDCNDFDPTVGELLFEDDFSEDSGFFAPTEQLDDPWSFEDGKTIATDGGQQAQLGQPQDWDDVVVFAKLSARGTKANCGQGSDQEPCSGTDRWRAGVLVRANADADQDEGYHGYRCALSSNAENGCFEDGLFLQLAEFMDAPEDDIQSECGQPGDCPPNTTFDQIDRQNHQLIDLGAGDAGYLTFYAVGQNMHCEAISEDGQHVTVSGSDDSFATGTVGLSTLNIYGEFDHVRVCRALALPDAASLSLH